MNGSATSTPHEPAPPHDPVARWMLLVAGVLAVTIVGLVLAYTLAIRSIDAPRTADERALQVARVAVDADPLTQANHLALARAYAQAGRYDDALETVERAYQLGESGEALFTEADVLRAAGRFSQAVPVYDRAEDLARTEYEALLARLREQSVIEEPPNTLLGRVLFGRGLCRLEIGEPDEAADDFTAALEITPTDAALLVALGDAWADAGEPDQAARAYRRALEFVSNLPEARAGLDALERGSTE